MALLLGNTTVSTNVGRRSRKTAASTFFLRNQRTAETGKTKTKLMVDLVSNRAKNRCQPSSSTRRADRTVESPQNRSLLWTAAMVNRVTVNAAKTNVPSLAFIGGYVITADGGGPASTFVVPAKAGTH